MAAPRLAWGNQKIEMTSKAIPGMWNSFLVWTVASVRGCRFGRPRSAGQSLPTPWGSTLEPYLRVWQQEGASGILGTITERVGSWDLLEDTTDNEGGLDMAHPVPGPPAPLDRVVGELGVSRSSLRRFAARMAEVLALPSRYTGRILRALETAPPIPLIWLSGQDCGGNTESLLRAEAPSVATLLLDWLIVDYHELLMAPAGLAAERARQDAMASFPHGYVAVVEGGIPLADEGVYCTIGGRTFADIVKEVCEGALATIAVGTCAWDGGMPAASGGITGAVGVEDLLKRIVISLPGCPMNGENLLATLVHYLTFGEFPPLDPVGRPLFAYGTTIHGQCERLEHFKAKRFAREWGDEGYRQGWCLLYMGCKGVYTAANCPTMRFNGGTAWPVSAGHPCIGCTMPGFWDAMAPFYNVGRARNRPLAISGSPAPVGSPS